MVILSTLFVCVIFLILFFYAHRHVLNQRRRKIEQALKKYNSTLSYLSKLKSISDKHRLLRNRQAYDLLCKELCK